MSLWATVLALVGPAAIPPPLPQTAADCVQPTYASDQLVCGDAELLALDREVAAAAPRPELASDSIWETPPAWLRRRSRCAFATDHRGCLIAAYRARVAGLRALGEMVVPVWLDCPAGWHAGRLQAGFSASTVVLRDADGRLFAVAVKRADGRRGAELDYRVTGNRVLFSGATSGTVTCRITMGRQDDSAAHSP